MTIMATTSIDQSIPTSTNGERTRAAIVGLGLIAIATVGGFLFIEAFGRLQVAFGFGDSFMLTFLLGGFLATLVYAIVALAYLRFRPVKMPYRFRLSTREWAWVVGGVVVMFVAAIAISILSESLGAEASTNMMAAAAVENPLLVYGAMFVGVLVFIGPVEELLFRGVVQGRLREVFGPVLAIAITSIGFAFGHVPNYWLAGTDLLSLGLLLSLVSITAGGVVLGVIYERTANLTVVALVHGLFNATIIGLIAAGVL